MIVIRIQGGLGNQLFQYAFAYSESRKFFQIFQFDDTIYYILPKFFRVGNFYNLIFQLPYIRRFVRKKVKSLKEKNYIDLLDCNITYSQLKSAKEVYYDGFFQSISFFENYEKQIKNKFRVRKKYLCLFNQKYGEIISSKKILVIHIRRTDYLKHGEGKNLGRGDLSLPLDYYKKCLNEIQNLNQYEIYVIGDDEVFAKKYFSHLPNVNFDNNEMIVDFQLLMNADIAIISNSTFAWWGVYLNKNINKKVYAPQYFLGCYINKEFPCEISYKLPYKWIPVL